MMQYNFANALSAPYLDSVHYIHYLTSKCVLVYLGTHIGAVTGPRERYMLVFL